MSSEMRELMQSVLDFVNRQPCRCMSIAQLGERDYCDRCQSVKNLRALLARTEAGADGACAKHGAMWAKGCAACDRDLDQMPGPPNASPVANGAAMLVRDVCEMAPADPDAPDTVCIRVTDLTRIAEQYTHPQDASGDAEKDAEIARLNAIINSPQSDDFLRAVSTEAEHQRQRWGSDHDAGKAPADWFWLVGYLGGKALHSHATGDTAKAEHHIITTAAACANWHRAMFGRTDMRPGIDGLTAMQAKEAK